MLFHLVNSGLAARAADFNRSSAHKLCSQTSKVLLNKSPAKRSLSIRVLALMSLGLLLSSCGAAGSPSPGEASSASRSGPAGGASQSTTSAPPTVKCAAFLPSAPCSPYTSVSGEANGKDLPWVAAGGITLKLTDVGGSLYLTAKTPCTPVDTPVTITGSTLHAGKIAVDAASCASEFSIQQQWFVDFLQRPVDMAYSNGVLKWVSGSDILTFKNQ